MRLLLINDLSGAFRRAAGIGDEPKRQQTGLDFGTFEIKVDFTIELRDDFG